MAHTLRFTRRKLPHWEIEGGRYFVTVRCADSLPREVIQRLADTHRAMAAIESRCRDHAAARRELFRCLEKYLDAGSGECPLRSPRIAGIVVRVLEALSTRNITVPHYTIMPNHWHALLVPEPTSGYSLSAVMRLIKGRTARQINLELQRTGALWQREWFDHWIRDEAEWERCRAYIHANPVKAGLVPPGQQHPWTK